MERRARPPFRDGAGSWVVTRYGDALAALDDPALVVPAPGAGGPYGTLAWLRGTVCRFAEGEIHRRRRAVAAAALADMDPAALRHAARIRAAHVLATTDRAGDVARRVPVAVLGQSLGVTGGRDLELLSEAARVVAAVYLTGADRPEAREAADAAVGVLVDLLGPGTGSPFGPGTGSPFGPGTGNPFGPGTGNPFGPGTGEWVANRIAVLVQACEATAGLIERGVHILGTHPDAAGWPADTILAETLRFDPPLPALRRVAVDPTVLGGRRVAPGHAIVIDVRAVNRDPAAFPDPGRFDPGRFGPFRAGARRAITFGVGRRECPGARQAMALAAGVVEALGEADVITRVKEQA